MSGCDTSGGRQGAMRHEYPLFRLPCHIFAKKSFAVYIKRNHTYFILTLKYKDLNICLLRDAAEFLKISL